ncbi:MAG: pentapeptide repeat-containing protein [Rhodoluna sp.]|nr:pentapeptide repeat-containing protein [Rhodoluna sp.]
MFRKLGRLALVAAVALFYSPITVVEPASATSSCEQLRIDITAAVNASSQYGQSVPNLCTNDCPSLYAYYSNFPEVPYHDALSSRLMDLFAACNVSKVPPTGIPTTETTQTPRHEVIKCPKINKDMHGRKDFAGTTCLAGKTLAGFNLSGMDLTGASLRSTNLTSANLNGTKLIRSDLSRANLDFSNLQSADLSSATVNDIRASHVEGSPRSLPYDFKLVKGFLFGPHVDLSKVWLKGLTLDNLNLSYANLSDTVLDGAKLSNLNISQAKFTPSVAGTTTRSLTGRPATFNVLIVNGFLIAEGVNLSGVNLSYANLRGKTIKGVSLANANLSGAYLTDAKFIDVSLKGARLDNAQLDRAVLDKCDLTGGSIQRASATGASFASAKLERVDFSNSNLTGANLSYASIYSIRVGNADLSKVRMDGVRSNVYVSGTPKALPAGWVIVNGYLKKP